MTLSPMPVPTVKDRVGQAFTLMGLEPETYRRLESLLVYEFYRNHSSAFEAREWDTKVEDTLQHIARSVREAIQQAGPNNQPSEALMCAIAMRDMDRQGVRGLAMLGKHPEAVGLIAEARGIHTEFMHVMRDEPPNIKTYNTVGPAAQFMVQLHALDITRRVILRVSETKNPLTPFNRSILIQQVNRLRPLMAGIGGDLPKRYNYYVGILDQTIFGLYAAATQNDNVIRLPQRNPAGTRYVKT